MVIRSVYHIAMRKPNLLLVMTDHQRGDTVLPDNPCLTPNLDRLAEQGVRFTDAFCSAPHCCPSRATFWTGHYPSRHGVWNNICNTTALSTGLKPGISVWSDGMAAAGYRMVWSGKWHVSLHETPKDTCWEERHLSGYRYMEHGIYGVDPGWELYRGVAEQGEPVERPHGSILRPGYGPRRMYGEKDNGNDRDERTMEIALDALQELTSDSQPWALWVGLIAPHDPYTPPQRLLDLYDPHKVQLPPSFSDELADKPQLYQRMRRQIFDQLSEEETREAIRHYLAYVTHLDERMGQLLEVLDGSRQAEDTLVVYLSDHGDYCGDHGLFAKGIPCFRGCYHIPVVARWPEGIRNPGRDEDAFVSLADFAPTFRELTGLKVAPDLAGDSLVPFFRDETPQDWRDEIHTQCNGVELYVTQRSVSTREWKYVFNGFDYDELYDLQNDPHEMKNLAADSRYDSVKHELVTRMWTYGRRHNDMAISNYTTVALAPWGPAEAYRDEVR